MALDDGYTRSPPPAPIFAAGRGPGTGRGAPVHIQRLTDEHIERAYRRRGGLRPACDERPRAEQGKSAATPARRLSGVRRILRYADARCAKPRLPPRRSARSPGHWRQRRGFTVFNGVVCCGDAVSGADRLFILSHAQSGVRASCLGTPVPSFATQPEFSNSRVTRIRPPEHRARDPPSSGGPGSTDFSPPCG